MTNVEFRETLKGVFNTHSLMRNREIHTVNELLYILRYSDAFKGNDYNISISKKDGGWASIPSLDTFVPISYLSIWFEDKKVEFENEECFGEIYNCITIYESEEN